VLTVLAGVVVLKAEVLGGVAITVVVAVVLKTEELAVLGCVVGGIVRVPTVVLAIVLGGVVVVVVATVVDPASTVMTPWSCECTAQK